MILIVTFVLIQSISANVILDCNYDLYSMVWLENLYTCHAKVIQIDETRNVVGVSQNHLPGKTDDDVKMITFYEQRIDFIPRDINKYFKYLDGIDIVSCPIKSFTKDDLKPFPKLKYFALAHGLLTAINGDVLMYSPALLRFYVAANQITNIGPGIFDHSSKLYTIVFQNKLCINSNADNNREDVINIARELVFRCPPSVEMIEEIILDGENFHTAVNSQIHPEINVIDSKLKQLEDKILELSNNHSLVLTGMQQLTADNKILNETLDLAKEKIVQHEGEIEALTSNQEKVLSQMRKLEEDIEVLSYNHTKAMERIQKLEKKNEFFEQFIFNLCAIYAVCPEIV